MSLREAPVARTHMLIRRPVGLVLVGFVDPAVTSRFWFSRGSARLDQAAAVTWHWDMYRAEAHVTVKVVLPERPDPELERFVAGWSAGKSHNPRQGMEA